MLAQTVTGRYIPTWLVFPGSFLFLTDSIPPLKISCDTNMWMLLSSTIEQDNTGTHMQRQRALRIHNRSLYATQERIRDKMVADLTENTTTPLLLNGSYKSQTEIRSLLCTTNTSNLDLKVVIQTCTIMHTHFPKFWKVGVHDSTSLYNNFQIKIRCVCCAEETPNFSLWFIRVFTFRVIHCSTRTTGSVLALVALISVSGLCTISPHTLLITVPVLHKPFTDCSSSRGTKNKKITNETDLLTISYSTSRRLGEGDWVKIKTVCSGIAL